MRDSKGLTVETMNAPGKGVKQRADMAVEETATTQDREDVRLHEESAADVQGRKKIDTTKNGEDALPPGRTVGKEPLSWGTEISRPALQGELVTSVGGRDASPRKGVAEEDPLQ